MIEKGDMRRIASKRGIHNLGYAEKDYLLDFLLYAVSQSIKNELIFKGGTCLARIFGLRRFSEDLDFSIFHLDSDFAYAQWARKILAILRRFNIEGSLATQKLIDKSLLMTFHFKGPLYSGKPSGICSLRMDINFQTKVVHAPLPKPYSSPYSDVPTCLILVMDGVEIAAEKIRATFVRDKARDIYDLYFLLRNDYHPSIHLINDKLLEYHRSFNLDQWEEALRRKEGLWEKELTGLVFEEVPSFIEVSNYIIDLYKK